MDANAVDSAIVANPDDDDVGYQFFVRCGGD